MQLDFCRSVSTLGILWVEAPFKVNGAGHYVLSAVSSGEPRSLMGNGSNQSVSRSEWAGSMKRANLHHGGFRAPDAEDGLFRFYPPPSTFSARGAVASGDVADPSLSPPEKTVMELHVNLAHAPVQQS